jgi:hypothetical protein
MLCWLLGGGRKLKFHYTCTVKLDYYELRIFVYYNSEN